MGADVVLDYREVDVVAEVKNLPEEALTLRLKRWARKRPLKTHYVCYGLVGRSLALVSIPASCRYRMKRWRLGSGIIALLRPCPGRERAHEAVNGDGQT